VGWIGWTFCHLKIGVEEKYRRHVIPHIQTLYKLVLPRQAMSHSKYDSVIDIANLQDYVSKYIHLVLLS